MMMLAPAARMMLRGPPLFRKLRFLMTAYTFAGADDHVSDVLSVGYIARRADSDFGKRIESRAVRDLDR